MSKIIQDHNNCIGCGSCAMLCQKFWEINHDEGKAFLKGAKKNENGEFELEVEEVGCNQDAADSCPVQVIKIL